MHYLVILTNMAATELLAYVSTVSLCNGSWYSRWTFFFSTVFTSETTFPSSSCLSGTPNPRKNDLLLKERFGSCSVDPSENIDLPLFVYSLPSAGLSSSCSGIVWLKVGFTHQVHQGSDCMLDFISLS